MTFRPVLQQVVLLLAGAGLHGTAMLPADIHVPGPDSSQWDIRNVYNYLSTMGEELSDKDVSRYCRYLIDSQEPERGVFADRFGHTIYSVKAFYLLQRFGYTPRYPLSVCQHLGKDLHYCTVDDQIISESSDPELFRRWLDRVRDEYDAYAAGSLIGHFITPHVLNLKRSGRPLEQSPFLPVFRQWLLDNQGENGFWNRPDDTDFNGWNGVMKMDQALRLAEITLPRQDRMIRTVLKHQNPEDGNFTAAGGCTNHNALHTLRQWSKRNDLLMWPEIFLAMERFADSAERRYDPVSGDFRTIPGFDGRPDRHATQLVLMSVGNIDAYCRMLLDPSNQPKMAAQADQEHAPHISPDRIRRLLVQVSGLAALAQQRIQSDLRAERELSKGGKSPTAGSGG